MSVVGIQSEPLVRVASELVVYVGRSDVAVPEGAGRLTDRDVYASTLTTALGEAALLVILDALSFPYEMLSEAQWDVPMLVSVPDELPAGDVVDVLAPVFDRLGFFDLFAVTSDEAWEALRARHAWGMGQRVPVRADDPEGVVRYAVDLLQRDADAADAAEADEVYDPVSYWRRRGKEVGPQSQHRAICSIHHDLRFNKAMHRAQAGALVPQFDEVRELSGGRSRPLRVLEVGTGVGRWATFFPAGVDVFSGVDISASMVEIARENFPEHTFETVDQDARLPQESDSFDLVMSITVLHHNPPVLRRALLREMWRVTRPTGHLLLLEQVVAAAPRPQSTVYRMSPADLVEDVLRASLGRVVLEHARAVRYPHDEMYRSLLLRLTKLGRSTQW